MSFWIHCNLCTAVPSKSSSITICISSCGHLICGKCLQRGGIEAKSPQLGMRGRCGVCGKSSSYRVVNSNLPPEIKILFNPLTSIVQQQSKTLSTVINFQAGHKARFCKLMEHKRLVEMQTRLRKSAETERCLMADNEKLQHDLAVSTQQAERMERELDCMRRELQQAKGGIPTLHSGGSSSHLHSSGSGPSFCNVVASTPLSNEKSFFVSDVHRRATNRMTGGEEEGSESSFHVIFDPYESPSSGAPDLFKTPAFVAPMTKMTKSKRWF